MRGYRKRKKTNDIWTMPIPADLEGEAKTYWRRHIPDLVENRTIRDKDYDAFVRLCRLHGLMTQCMKVIEEKGLTYETPSGRIVRRPEADTFLRLNSEIKDLEAKFGLTPIDAPKIKKVRTSDGKNTGVRGKYGA